MRDGYEEMRDHQRQKARKPKGTSSNCCTMVPQCVSTSKPLAYTWHVGMIVSEYIYAPVLAALTHPHPPPHNPQERKFGVWIGGSILGSLVSFCASWMLAIAGSEGRRRDKNRPCFFPVTPSSVKSVEVGRVIGPDSYV